MTKDQEPKCPECGAEVNLHDNGFFLMGRKTVKCANGHEIVATARITA